MKRRIYIALLSKCFLCLAVAYVWLSFDDICRLIKGFPLVEREYHFEDIAFPIIACIPSILQLGLECLIVKTKEKPFFALLLCNILSIDIVPVFCIVYLADTIFVRIPPYFFAWIFIRVIILWVIYKIIKNK